MERTFPPGSKYAHVVIRGLGPEGDKHGLPEPEPDETAEPSSAQVRHSEQVMFRAAPKLAAGYRAKAKAADMTLAEWIRSRLA